MGELVFSKVQYGLEGASAQGTAVAATKAFPGTLKAGADRKPQFPKQSLGLRVQSQTAVIHQILADGLTLSLGDTAVFQKLPFLLSMGLKGAVVAVESTSAQSDYLWDFSHSLTASNAPDSFTIEFGDDTQAYEIEFCMAKRYRFAGKFGEDAGVEIEAELFGKQITPTTFTSSLLVAADTAMSANMAKIYVDTTWAGLGGTEKSGLMREWSIEIVTGLHPVFASSGGKTMLTYGQGFLDCMATFTFEGNTDADTLFDLFQAGTARAIRVSMLGPTIAAGTPHSLIVDMFGSFEEIVPLGSEKDGNNLHTALFHTHGNALSTPKHFAVTCTTNSNAL